MPLLPLPPDVWSQVIEQYLLDCDLSKGLELRLVNAQFNNEILRQLFFVSLRDLRSIPPIIGVPRNLAIFHLQGFFSKRVVPLKSQRKSRRTIFQAINHNPDKDEGISQNRCFMYRPYEESLGPLTSSQAPELCCGVKSRPTWRSSCRSALVGPSNSSGRRDCNACDMMNAMVSLFDSTIFGFGANTDESYDGCLPRDGRYWQVLMACQRNNVSMVRNLLEDIASDESLEESKVASVFCDCFLIATRMNYPAMVTTLHEEAKDREDVPTKLGKRPEELNCLSEAIRLGHCEVFGTLLKWNWKFNQSRSNRNYVAYLQLILDGRLYLDNGVEEQQVREKLMRTLLDWTENWRNISEMKEFLIKVGRNNAQWALQAAVDTLRSLHHFRHERGEEGRFDAADPLNDIAFSGNLEMLKLYFENEHLLLPHTTADQSMRMRCLVIRAEFDRLQEDVRVDVLKLIIEHSPDLLTHQSRLQTTVIDQYDKKLETWAWLAKKIGLDSACEDHNNQSLGSVMLGLAVSKLNVETVRFLVNKKVQLASEASTFQVYEDDDETMKRLLIVRELLGKGGQGAVKERAVIETTFLPINVPTRRRRLSDMSIRMRSNHRAGSVHSAAKIVYACPSKVRRSVGSVSRSASAKQARSSVPDAGVSNDAPPSA